MDAIPAEALGPKMRALRTDLQRRFAWLMAGGASTPTEAARRAGYSDVKEGAKVRAHYLMHDPAVLDAIEEASRCVLRGLAPIAVSAVKNILEDAKHPSHARMIEVVLDRTGFAAKTEHEVSVKHSVDFREVEALARRLAAESGVPAARLLGPNVIEGEVVDAPVDEA